MSTAEEVYYSLTGELTQEARLSWVEDAFVPGSVCDRQYTNAYDAYRRLAERLGNGDRDENADVEIIFNSFLEIQKALCLKMFEYGRRHEKTML